MTKAITILALTCFLVAGAAMTSILFRGNMEATEASVPAPIVKSPVANRETKQDRLTVASLALAAFDPLPTAAITEPLRQAYAAADIEAAKAAAALPPLPQVAAVEPAKPKVAAKPKPVPGDAESARWEVPVTVRRDADDFDFSGPFVGGTRDDRSLGLAWGEVPGDGTLRLFRGAKLRLVDVDPALSEEAMQPGHRLVARIRLTDPRGNPVCARVHSPALTWSVLSA